MISKRLTTFALSVLCAILTVGALNAQTFNGSTTNTAGNSAIPSVGTGGCGVEPQTAVTGGTTFNNTVAGLTNQTVQSVQLNLTHTWDGDLNIFLQAPNGQRISLSQGNGGTGDNFTNTVFIDAAPTPITAGAAPFTGSFRPQGTIGTYTCGASIAQTVGSLVAFTTAQNGTWQLRIFDSAGGDSGTMISWSITFAPPCGFVAASLPPITLNGTNPAVCGGSTTLTVPAITATCAAGTLVTISLDNNVVGSQLPGTTYTTPVLPLGSHTVVFSLPNGLTLTQVINVNDLVAPVIVCPSNITVNLDPGACSQIYNYTTSFTDNCPLFGPATTSQVHGASASNSNNFATITFGIKNVSTSPIKITGVNANLGDFPGPGFNGTVPTRLLFGPINGAGSTTGTPAIGTWTPTAVQNINVSVTSYFQTTFVPIPAASQFVLQPGEARGVAVQSTGNFMRYANGNETSTNGTLQIISNGHYAGDAVATLGNTPRLFKGSVVYQAVSPAVPVQTSGLASGSTFPRGVTNNCFTATDAAGNTASCCFSVTVLEFPNAVTSLVCNDLVYFSVDENCSGVVGADDVLEGGPYGCYDDYIVELDKTAPFGNGPWVPAIAGPGDVGKTYQVRVTDPTTGNKCWGNIKFEDKLPPVLLCHDITLPCNGNPDVFPNNQPYPAITGAQTLTQKVNNPIGEAGAPVPDVQNYSFNYGYLPAGTPVLDVNVRIKLTGHTWLPDLDMVVKSPSGTTVDVFTLTGCLGTEYPIDRRIRR